VTIDCPLLEEEGDAAGALDGFYKTLRYASGQALCVTMELDKREIDGFISRVLYDPEATDYPLRECRGWDQSGAVTDGGPAFAGGAAKRHEGAASRQR